MRIDPESAEQRDSVMRRILGFVQENRTIKLPDFDPSLATAYSKVALVSVGLEPNDFGGTVDEFRYQFEGEEDLLHLIVTRTNGDELSVEEAQGVAGFLLRGVSPALIWLRPGHLSQHFYFGHDDLIDQLEI